MAPYGGGRDHLIPVPEYYAALYFQRGQVRVTEDGILQAPYFYDRRVGAVFDDEMIAEIKDSLKNDTRESWL
jgi:hypothetical protein